MSLSESIEFLSHVIDDDEKVYVPYHLGKVLAAARKLTDAEKITVEDGKAFIFNQPGTYAIVGPL